MQELVIEKSAGRAVVTLNRTQALNALTLEMIQSILAALVDFERDPRIESVEFTGAGTRAFCAGGDIKLAYETGQRYKQNKGEHPNLYFAYEYQMNRALFHFPKPMTAYMNGITMGGGFGVAGPCDRRIAYANTVFAMPEVGIGLFPDVGSMYFLNRCPGEIGAYLAVTGRSIGPGDMIYAGLATDYDGDVPPGELSDLQEQIDRHFRFDRVEEILESLSKASSEWAQETKALIETRSPTSLKISLRHLRTSKGKSFDEVTEQDFNLTHHVMEGHDFYEGVRAALIDKDKTPKWMPTTLAEVDEKTVAGYFSSCGLKIDDIAGQDKLG